MYDFIDYAGEKRPNWSDDQFYWMAVCEHIAAHWYFILTMDGCTGLIVRTGGSERRTGGFQRPE